ncbi:hypothetical protein [Actibacterium sp. 188UL27-1]|uniref:hypothetical protein n=1 Tax=Actibacterium sp. 188UL27-1 TaxID=2786961 RepID=UPI00195E84EA|nr:hypothetical protein [Actibacterium sp. 188UL27-1]MBM7069040.1 hypothetical protein [Actibacterium sp. 188UL27-1]
MAKHTKSRLLGKRLVVGAALGTAPLAGGFADRALGDQPMIASPSVEVGERSLYQQVRASRDAGVAIRFLRAYPDSPLVPHVLLSLPAGELSRLPREVIDSLSIEALHGVPVQIQLQLGIPPQHARITRSTKGVSDGYSGGGTDRDITPKIVSASAPLSQQNTLLILRAVEESSDRCSGVPDIYKLDCLRSEFERIAQDLPKTGEYAPVQKTIARAARDLSRLVRSNRDTTKPRAVVQQSTTAPRQSSRGRSFRAVQEPKLQQTNAAARAIVDEASTRLLRSAGNSVKRRAHFQEVAQVLNSSKVLLRS